MQPASLRAKSEALESRSRRRVHRPGTRKDNGDKILVLEGNPELVDDESGEKRWGGEGQNRGGGGLSHPLPGATIGAKHRGVRDEPVIICDPALILRSPHKHTHSPSAHVSQLTFSNPPSFLSLFAPRAGIPALGRFAWIPSAIVAVSTATLSPERTAFPAFLN